MFILEQVVVELLNLVISVYHVPTVFLDRASILFPTCDFPTCPSIINKYMWSRLPIKAHYKLHITSSLEHIKHHITSSNPLVPNTCSCKLFRHTARTHKFNK
jgi:hypothetical protein